MTIECISYVIFLFKIYYYKAHVDFAISKAGVSLTYFMNGADFMFNVWGWSVITSDEAQAVFRANDNKLETCEMVLMFNLFIKFYMYILALIFMIIVAFIYVSCQMCNGEGSGGNQTSEQRSQHLSIPSLSSLTRMDKVKDFLKG